MIYITIAQNPYVDQTRSFTAACSEAQRLAAKLTAHAGAQWSWANANTLVGPGATPTLVPAIESILRHQFDLVDHAYHVELKP